MCEVAAHLTDHVLPHVPARQWVLSVPKRLRPYLHHDVCVASAVLQILLRAIRATLRRSSPGAPPRAQLGAVSFLDRFGSSLNVHPHYHLVVLDGVFSKADDSEIEFHEGHDLTPDHIAQVESLVQQRILRYFRRHGLLNELDAVGKSVPPPRVHRHRYHGVLAPNARLKSRVVAFDPAEPDPVPDFDFDPSLPDDFDL